MQLLIWLLIIVTVYFFLVFVVLRLFVPFLGFKQFSMPTELPPEIRQTITDLENKSQTPAAYLQAVYDFIMDKNAKQWKHTRFKAATKLPRMFVSDLTEIWQTQDFLYCTAINYAAFVLLAGSKFFKASDVKTKHVFVNFIIHQYLQVSVDHTSVDFDPAGTGIRGLGLGHHLSFFG